MAIAFVSGVLQTDDSRSLRPRRGPAVTALVGLRARELGKSWAFSSWGPALFSAGLATMAVYRGGLSYTLTYSGGAVPGFAPEFPVSSAAQSIWRPTHQRTLNPRGRQFTHPAGFVKLLRKEFVPKACRRWCLRRENFSGRTGSSVGSHIHLAAESIARARWQSEPSQSISSLVAVGGGCHPLSLRTVQLDFDDVRSLGRASFSLARILADYARVCCCVLLWKSPPGRPSDALILAVWIVTTALLVSGLMWLGARGPIARIVAGVIALLVSIYTSIGAYSCYWF